MLAKSWRRIKNNILLYKSGTEGFANSGLEPYSEYYASQIAKTMDLHYVELLDISNREREALFNMFTFHK